MNEIEKLEKEIAILRKRLNSAIDKENGNHVPSDELLKISQELDVLIVRYQTFLMDGKK